MDFANALESAADILPEKPKAFLDHLEQAWVEEALASTDSATIRRRRLPAEQVLCLVVGLSIMRGRSIVDVADKLDIALPGRAGVAPSALSQARKKLGPAPVQWLFHRSSRHWVDKTAERYRWRGLLVQGVDGTKLNVPDSPANNERFDKHAGQHGRSGYPLTRIVAVMVLGSRICRDASIASFADHELVVARPLWDRVDDNTLTIVDRGFFCAPVLHRLGAQGTNRH